MRVLLLEHLPVHRVDRLRDRDQGERLLHVAARLDAAARDRHRHVLLALEVLVGDVRVHLIFTSGSQATSSVHSQTRLLPSLLSSDAVMFTTRSRSGNSKRCGVSASRSFGPMSGSVLIISNTRSMTSRNSFAFFGLPIWRQPK